MLFHSGPRANAILIALVLFVPVGYSFIGPVPRAVNEELSRAVKACQLLKDGFPQLVTFPGSQQFAEDVVHWAFSSQQNSTCSIEPESAEDVSAIIKVVGRSDVRAPFAVKSGGHAYNPRHSSTPGVQISMARFTNVSYNAEQETVSLGLGLTWDRVYEQLPLGVMVAGGRIPGVGVGGLSLGGGFSWKTNQFGLTIDTIVSHELVLPSGELVHVTNTSEPDLSFGLKGGLNNFGIVTSITLEAHKQTEVFGGVLIYSSDTSESFYEAVADFSQNNTDPKAQAIITITSNGTLFQNIITLFYDAPTPPAGVLDRILSIPAVSGNVKMRTFVDFMSSIGDIDPGTGPFGFAGHVIPILKYTVPILDEIATQVNAFAGRLTRESNGSPVVVSLTPEPFVHPFAHSFASAFPHPPSRETSPMGSYIFYQGDPEAPIAVRAARHAAFAADMKTLTHLIQAKAVQEGQSLFNDILYPNYALADTPLELMYGENVPRLKALAAKFDPDKVMSLTGGFHFQH